VFALVHFLRGVAIRPAPLPNDFRQTDHRQQDGRPRENPAEFPCSCSPGVI
jgi:hypothetical protein